jgi:GxxExxY protein
VPEVLNSLCERVIGAAIEVHRELGPGFLERVYEEAMAHELGLRHIDFVRQAELPVMYMGVQLCNQRFDLLVEGALVIELKAVDGVCDAHLAQLVGYLRAMNLPLGVLMNFNESRLVDGVYRRVNSRALNNPSTSSATSATPPRPPRTPV